MVIDIELETILKELEIEEKEYNRYLCNEKYRNRNQVIKYIAPDYNMINYLTLCINIYFCICIKNITEISRLITSK